MKKTNKTKGFTLIELMITVAIVGILSAVAVPAYQDYTTRAQIAEGLSLASGLKIPVIEYFSQNGMLPTSIDEIGDISGVGKFVGNLDIRQDGSIVAMFNGNDSNKAILGKKITLEANPLSNGVIYWKCTSDLAQKYLPSICDADFERSYYTTGTASFKYKDGVLYNNDVPLNLVLNEDGLRVYESEEFMTAFDDENNIKLVYKGDESGVYQKYYKDGTVLIYNGDNMPGFGFTQPVRNKIQSISPVLWNALNTAWVEGAVAADVLSSIRTELDNISSNNNGLLPDDMPLIVKDLYNTLKENNP